MGIPGGSWKKTNNKQNGGLIELVGRDRGRKEERKRERESESEIERERERKELGLSLQLAAKWCNMDQDGCRKLDVTGGE